MGRDGKGHLVGLTLDGTASREVAGTWGRAGWGPDRIQQVSLTFTYDSLSSLIKYAINMAPERLTPRRQ